jgi:hypothetical protein
MEAHVSILSEFENRLPAALRGKFLGLSTPAHIQIYLDSMPYIAEERDRSPLNVMLDGQSHCLDGGLFAALALWRIGFPPLLLDLVPEPGADDDHVLALYRLDGRWGALAKSNYVNLGFREPVHASLRELAMTYFEHFVNVSQQKTLRGYTRPFDASRYANLNWAVDEADANRLYKIFYARKFTPLVAPQMAARLERVTDRAYKAETLYTDLGWSFGNRPDK